MTATPLPYLFQQIFSLTNLREALSLARTYFYSGNKSHLAFTLFAIAANIVFVGLYVAYAYIAKHHYTDSLLFANYNFTYTDGSYAETFGYGLELITAGLFLALAIAHRQRHWFVWAFIFIIMFLDDAYLIHENIGLTLTGDYGVPNYLADVLGFASIGAIIGTLWLIGLFLNPPEGKQMQTYFLFSIYLAALIFFAVFVDALHSRIFVQWKIHAFQTLFGLMEDGMELMIISLFAISVLGFWCTEKHKLSWKK